jgi:hypothetical protein
MNCNGAQQHTLLVTLASYCIARFVCRRCWALNCIFQIALIRLLRQNHLEEAEFRLNALALLPQTFILSEVNVATVL